MNRTTSEVPPTLESVRALLRARQLEQAQKEAERLVGARADDAEARFLLGIVQAERQCRNPRRARREVGIVGGESAVLNQRLPGRLQMAALLGRRRIECQGV